MRTARRIAPLTVLLGLLALSGCYTVLSHPAGSSDIAGGAYAGSGSYRSCSDCHADAAYYHPYYHYGRSHYRWGDYYGFPWWYDDYWWWQPDGDGDGEPGPDVETGTRHIWNSGSGGSKGWSFVLPPSQPASETEREGQDDTGQSGSDEQDGKKKEDGERHLWKPKKKGF